MAYDSIRPVLGTSSLAAQNVVMTASGAIAPGTTVTAVMLGADATFLCSIAGYVTATPANFPAGVRPYVIVGTTTYTSTGIASAYLAQSSASSGLFTFSSPGVALSSAQAYTIGLVATGTASATQTLGATLLTVGAGPQFI